MALSRNEIENVASHYARQYDVWGQLTDLEEIVKHLGHDDFYLYRKLCQVKNWHILSKKIKFPAEIPSRGRKSFLRRNE